MVRLGIKVYVKDSVLGWVNDYVLKQNEVEDGGNFSGWPDCISHRDDYCVLFIKTVSWLRLLPVITLLDN